MKIAIRKGSSSYPVISSWRFTVYVTWRRQQTAGDCGSWRAAEHAGFVWEGLLRSFQQIGTHRRDMYLYSLLPADADAAGAAGECGEAMSSRRTRLGG